VPVDLVRTPDLYPAPYAYAALSTCGRLVFTAGACPVDQEGRVAERGDIPAQTRRALANLRCALLASGADVSSVLKTTVYVASSSRSDMDLAWDEVRSFFSRHEAPSTLLGVAALGYPDQLVEIEAVAERPPHPREKGRPPRR